MIDWDLWYISPETEAARHEGKLRFLAYDHWQQSLIVETSSGLVQRRSRGEVQFVTKNGNSVREGDPHCAQGS